MNQQSSVPQVTHVIVSSPKSVGVAILLTFFFGPLGMLYSTVVGALVMLLISFLVSIFTFGIGLILVWPICILWGALAAASHNRQVLRSIPKA